MIWVILFLGLTPVSCVLVRKGHTPKIKSKGENIAVAKLEKIEIGGTPQAVLTRATNDKNPVLLFLHGGPGMPMMYLAHEFQRPLEKEFIVVQWDQRGAGKSYSPDIPISSMNIEQYLADALELIDTLQHRHGNQKIFLAAHSWGTYIGSILVNRHPELFAAYISIGQVVDRDQAEPLQLEFLINEANQRKDQDAIAALNTQGKRVFEKYLFKYGGELKNSKSYFPLIWSGMKCKEYSFQDVMNVSKGPSFCNRHMQYNAITGTIMETIRNYEVPVYFFAGRYDFTTPSSLTAQYHDSIQAPSKKFIWFNQSAHFPHFEEPKEFCRQVIAIKQQVQVR